MQAQNGNKNDQRSFCVLMRSTQPQNGYSVARAMGELRSWHLEARAHRRGGDLRMHLVAIPVYFSNSVFFSRTSHLRTATSISSQSAQTARISHNLHVVHDNLALRGSVT